MTVKIFQLECGQSFIRIGSSEYSENENAGLSPDFIIEHVANNLHLSNLKLRWAVFLNVPHIDKKGGGACHTLAEKIHLPA